MLFPHRKGTLVYGLDELVIERYEGEFELISVFHSMAEPIQHKVAATRQDQQHRLA